jgi:hypothetical protein
MSNERINILLKEYENMANKIENKIPLILPIIFLITYAINIAFALSNWKLYIPNDDIFSLHIPFQQDNTIRRYEIEDNNLQLVEPFMPSDYSTLSISLGILSLVILGYLIYRWIDTRNKHLTRIAKLYSIAVEMSELLNFKRSPIIRSRLDELTIGNVNRSVALNVVLGIIIPFYILYIFHFINKELVKHTRSEKLFLTTLIDDVKSKDALFSKSILDYKEVENKNTLLYIILSIITLGIFTIYWMYSLSKDYNEHIINQQILDNAILESLRRISS